MIPCILNTFCWFYSWLNSRCLAIKSFHSVWKKQQICLYSTQWPTTSAKQINNLFPHTIVTGTVLGILQRKDKCLSDTKTNETKKFKTAKHEAIEKNPLSFGLHSANNIPLIQYTLRPKAMECVEKGHNQVKGYS